MAVTAVTAMAASMLVYPAEAEVGPPRSITVIPADSIVMVEGLNHADTYTITVVRDGVGVGSATGSPTTFGVFGTLELNHDGEGAAGPFCWNGVTPAILPGDEVHVTGPGVVDSTTVQKVTVAGNPEPGLGPNGELAFTVTGTLGEGLDPAKLDVFVRLDLTPAAPGDDDDSPEAEDEDDDSGDWRASSSGPGNTLVLSDDGTTWTATFTTGEGAEETGPVTPEVLAVAASPRVLEATYGVGTPPLGEDHGGNENTTATFGGEPLPEGCPARDDSAIGQVTPAVINIANQTSDLTVSGVTESSGVAVTVSDGVNALSTPADGAVEVKPNGTWTATFPGPLTGLEGDLTVTAVHSGGQGAAAANTRHVLRDTVAPPTPQSFPDSTSFSGSIQVLLAGSGEMRYTEGNGSQPAPTATTGRRYTGTILLAQTTTIKAVAVDAAGNVSPVLIRTYTRNVPTVPTGPTGPTGPAGPVVTPQVPPPPGTGAATILPLAPGIAKARSGKRGGNDTATIRWRVPLANGAVVDGYQVRALKIRPGRSAKIRATESVAADVTKLRMTLRSGKYRFQVRAVSAAGTSPWSERSAKVTSR